MFMEVVAVKTKDAFGLAALAGLLTLFVPPPATLGGEAETPSASKILEESFKRLVESKSYRTKISVEGGVTQSRLHKLSTKTVDDTYIGTVYGGVMQVSNPRAFRTPTSGRGVIRKDGQWKQILAAKDGARMDRLFIWPQILMRRALKHKSTAAWIDNGNRGTKHVSKKEQKKSSSTSRRGRTGVTRTGEDEASRFPGTIRIETPTREALKHVIEVENSGCLSGG